MKKTIMILMVLLLTGTNGVWAFTFPKLPDLDFDFQQIISTPIPTPTSIIKLKLPIKELLPLGTTNPTVTIAPTSATESPTVTQKPDDTPTSIIVVVTASPTPQQPTATPTIDETTKNENGLTTWFLGATIGLLVIIILAQAWPKKKEE